MKYPILFLISSALVVVLTAMLRAIGGEPGDEYDGPSLVPKITAKGVENLAYIGGTDQEIADRFQVDVVFLRKRYLGVLRVARAVRNLSIRGWQFDLAKKLNGPMLMWLGRNLLKQSNHPTEPDEPMPEVDE